MDRRVRKTLKALEEAFIALERKKPADQITVAELTALADVGRGTFYLHYQDVNDLARHIAENHVDALLKRFAAAPPTLLAGSYRDWLNSLLQYLHSQQAGFALLRRSADAGLLRERICAAFAAQLKGEPLVVAYVVAGGYGVIAAWLNGELTNTQAALVALLDAQLQAVGTANGGLPSSSIK